MNRSLGVYISHAAAALYLLAAGALGLMEKNLWRGLRLVMTPQEAAGNEIADTLTRIFGTGNLSKTLIVLFSVLALLGGVFLLLQLFGLRIPPVDIILLVFLAVWLGFIVLSDLVCALKDTRNFVFLPWLKVFASHLVVLGTLVSGSHRFGN